MYYRWLSNPPNAEYLTDHIKEMAGVKMTISYIQDFLCNYFLDPAGFWAGSWWHMGTEFFEKCFKMICLKRCVEIIESNNGSWGTLWAGKGRRRFPLNKSNWYICQNLETEMCGERGWPDRNKELWWWDTDRPCPTPRALRIDYDGLTLLPSSRLLTVLSIGWTQTKVLA